MLLGSVLREQAEPGIYEAVEELRQSAIARREVENGAALLSVGEQANDPLRAYQLARAFSFYFELINLAETNHRKRRRLAHQLEEPGNAAAAGKVQRGSLEGTLRAMRIAGFDLATALEQLGRICVTPVFTAHPTEVARRSVMFKRRRISDLLEQLDRIPVPGAALEQLEASLLAEITALWADRRCAQRAGRRCGTKSGWRWTTSNRHSSIHCRCSMRKSSMRSRRSLGAEGVPALADLPLLVTFGSWIGGDRDGNPFVTPETTAEALTMARDLLFSHYLRRLQNIFDQLASSTQQVPVSVDLTARLEQYLAELRAAGPASPELRLIERFPHESVRLFVACMMVRLGGSAQYSVQPSMQEHAPRLRAPCAVRKSGRIGGGCWRCCARACGRIAACGSRLCWSIRSCSRLGRTGCICRR